MWDVGCGTGCGMWDAGEGGAGRDLDSRAIFSPPISALIFGRYTADMQNE